MCDPRIVIDTKKGAKLEPWQSIIGIQSVAQHLEQLESIDISGCFRLNKSIVKFAYRHLENHQFFRRNQVTTDSLIASPKAALCEHITLNDCGPAINDTAFKRVVKHCKFLQTVVAQRCLELREVPDGLSNCKSLVNWISPDASRSLT